MDYKIDQVNPDTLVPNPWNTNVVSPENEEKLDSSLKRFGVFKPVIVRELIDGTLQIIGGEHRAQSAARLGYKAIPIVNLGMISDQKAKEISLVDNDRFGEDDMFKLAELVGTLDVSELSSFTTFTDTDIDSMFTSSSIALEDLDSLSLPSEDIELPQEKSIQTHQIMRFKVPIKDVDAVTQKIEKAIKVQGFDDSDSLTNAGDALVHLLLKD